MAEAKICGLSEPATFDAVAEAGAEWVGFVFFPPSPRAVTPKQAGLLARRHAGGPCPVGLFVDPTDDEVDAALQCIELAVLQVHAGAERAAALRGRFGVPVWRSVGVAARSDLPQAAEGIDRLLLDYKAPAGAPVPGGNAQSFDWSILREWQPPAPWILAGGLTPATVAEAIRQTGAPVVDVSSGVERTRGVKDAGLIHSFVRAVRGA